MAAGAAQPFFRQRPEGRHRDSLATRNQHVLAQLHGPAGDSDHHQRLQHPFVGFAQLVAVDQRDGEDELGLLLQRVKRLAGCGAERQQRPQAGGDRSRPAGGTGRGDPDPGIADQLGGQLVVVEAGMGEPERVDPGSDRRLPAPDRPGQRPEDFVKLRREPVEVHSNHDLTGRRSG